MLGRRRTLLRAERAYSLPLTSNGFYIIGIDVGRIQCNTAITVVKVLPTDTNFKKHVVYLEVINGANFITEQSPRIKELINLYKPREVVVDSNGLGIGLMDALALPTTDPKTGQEYPAYYAFNNEQHLPPEMKNISDEPNPIYNAILYSLKADAGEDKNDAIHANLYSQLANRSISLLADEKIIKEKLLSTKKGQRMDFYDRRVFLLPYEMTSRLIDEINNLKLKPTGNKNQLMVEQISKSTPKDRFSSLEYTMWRVKYYEDKMNHKHKKKLEGKFSFFTPMKGGKNNGATRKI